MKSLQEQEFKEYECCTLCPRQCKANRYQESSHGVCRVGAELKLARAALHHWEEPCISGTNGSGAVFFSGCSMGCVFCQNQSISHGDAGVVIPKERLVEIFLELQEQGAHNINLVTPGHYTPHIIWAVEHAREQGLSIPIVCNTGGYELVDTIKRLEGIVDIYLPDFKYSDRAFSQKYSHAPDYPEVAQKAIAEMVRQQPKAVFGEDGLLQRGVVVRLLILPGLLHDARRSLRYLYEHYGNQIYYSLMSQYTPLAHVEKYPELQHRVSEEAYMNLVQYALSLGIEHGFTQEREVALESFIPAFDGEGVLPQKQ